MYCGRIPCQQQISRQKIEARGTRQRGEIGRNASSVRNGTTAAETENETQAKATATENDLGAWDVLNAEHAAEKAASKDDLEAKIDRSIGQQETLSSLKMAIEGQVDARGEGERRSDRKLFAILDEVTCVTEQNAEVLKQNAAILAAMHEQTKAIREQNAATLAAVQAQTKVAREQNAAILTAMQAQTKAIREQNAATLAVMQEQTKAIRGQLEATEKERVQVRVTSPLEGCCIWKIPNFSSLELDQSGKKYSDVFSIGGHKWKLSVYPRGEGPEKDQYVSLYLILADDIIVSSAQHYQSLCDYKVTADYTLSMICQLYPEKSRKWESSRNTEFKPPCWGSGWPDFMCLTTFYDATNGFLVNDTVFFIVEIKVKNPKRKR